MNYPLLGTIIMIYSSWIGGLIGCIMLVTKIKGGITAPLSAGLLYLFATGAVMSFFGGTGHE